VTEPVSKELKSFELQDDAPTESPHHLIMIRQNKNPGAVMAPDLSPKTGPANKLVFWYSGQGSLP
jgi:hypothetical protein